MTTPPAETSARLTEITSVALQAKGFEGGEPVHEYYNCFTKEEAQESLFRSTYSKVVPVTLASQKKDHILKVVLTRAEPRFASYKVVLGASSAGCYEDPDWYFEGWIPRSGHDAAEEVVRVRIFVGHSFNDTFLWQVIPRDPTEECIKVEAD